MTTSKNGVQMCPGGMESEFPKSVEPTGSDTSMFPLTPAEGNSASFVKGKILRFFFFCD